MHHIYILYMYPYIFIPSIYIYINAYLYTYKCISVCKKETHVQTDTGRAGLSECAIEMTFHPVQRCLMSSQGHHNSSNINLQTVTAFSFLFQSHWWFEKCTMMALFKNSGSREQKFRGVWIIL